MISETIMISGMSCGGCVTSVQRVLGRLPLTEMHVEIGRAEIEYDGSQVTHQQIVDAVRDAGYGVVSDN